MHIRGSVLRPHARALRVLAGAGDGPISTLYSASAGRAALNDLRDWPLPFGGELSSNVAQSYPYTTETSAERAAAVDRAAAQFDGLRDKIGAETDPLPDPGPAEPGRPHRSWVFICPLHIEGRLHVAGYAKERHAMYTVCDSGGETYLR